MLSFFVSRWTAPRLTAATTAEGSSRASFASSTAASAAVRMVASTTASGSRADAGVTGSARSLSTAAEVPGGTVSSTLPPGPLGGSARPSTAARRRVIASARGVPASAFSRSSTRSVTDSAAATSNAVSGVRSSTNPPRRRSVIARSISIKGWVSPALFCCVSTGSILKAAPQRQETMNHSPLFPTPHVFVNTGLASAISHRRINQTVSTAKE